MEQYRTGFDAICATDACKAHMIALMREQNVRPVASVPRRARQRRALIVAVAALLLLLAACTATVLFISSAVRAKEYRAGEQADAHLMDLAARTVDELMEGTTFYCPLTGTAEMDGLSIALIAAANEQNDAPELHLCFDASDAKTGDRSRLHDVDFTLLWDGEAYPVYAVADGDGRAKPAIANAPWSTGAMYELFFRLPRAVPDGTALSLCGTLHAYDGAEVRGESLGSFQLDFTYQTPVAEMEAERARLMQEVQSSMRQQAQEETDEVMRLPDEATPLNLTQGSLTLLDAAVTEAGVLLGTVSEVGWTDAGTNSGAFDFYMDGHRRSATVETLNRIAEPHTEADKNAHGEYPATVTTLRLLPWYAPMDELPDTVLVALLGEESASEFGFPGGDAVHTMRQQAISLAFRIDPRTGAITLPKDDVERAAWCEETARLAADGRNESFTLQLFGKQDLGSGVSVQLYDLMANAERRKVTLEWMVNGLYYPDESRREQAVIYIDGVRQSPRASEEPPFSIEEAKQRVERDGGWQRHNNCFAVSVLDMHPQALPESFTLRIVWDVYDRNEAWERVFIGTLDVTTTVNRTDIPPWEG